LIFGHDGALDEGVGGEIIMKLLVMVKKLDKRRPIKENTTTNKEVDILDDINNNRKHREDIFFLEMIVWFVVMVVAIACVSL
jgi:hypothetical protein